MTYYRVFAWFQIVLGGLAIFGSLSGPENIAGVVGGSLFLLGGIVNIILLDKMRDMNFCSNPAAHQVTKIRVR
jgi:hypothetical protein